MTLTFFLLHLLQNYIMSFQKGNTCAKIHGFSNHTGYSYWWHMNRRCDTDENPSYIRKNIQVSWIWNRTNPEGIRNFCQWFDDCRDEFDALTHPSLDRIHNDKDYFPDNCHFIENELQAYNRGKKITNQTGYEGVSQRKNRFHSRLMHIGKEKWLGSFNSKQEALQARNDYIRENNLTLKYPIQEWCG